MVSVGVGSNDSISLDLQLRQNLISTSGTSIFIWDKRAEDSVSGIAQPYLILEEGLGFIRDEFDLR